MGHPATWVSQEIALLYELRLMVDLQAATGSFLARPPKYTSSGVA